MIDYDNHEYLMG